MTLGAKLTILGISKLTQVLFNNDLTSNSSTGPS